MNPINFESSFGHFWYQLEARAEQKTRELLIIKWLEFFEDFRNASTKKKKSWQNDLFILYLLRKTATKRDRKSKILICLLWEFQIFRVLPLRWLQKMFAVRSLCKKNFMRTSRLKFGVKYFQKVRRAGNLDQEKLFLDVFGIW